MSSDFDFGAMLDAPFGGIRKGYKFGKAFNEDKSLVRPEKRPVEAGTEDNVAIKAAFEAGEAIAGIVEKETKGGHEVSGASSTSSSRNTRSTNAGSTSSSRVARCWRSRRRR